MLILITILSIFLAFGHGVFSAPTISSTLSQSDEEILSTAIEALPEADFENDFVLTRKSPDTFVNDQKIGRITYKLRTTHPKGASVIILNGHEDFLRRGEEGVSQQQTFVVLRKRTFGVDQSDEDKYYYVSYVYLRALFQDESPIGLGLVEMSDGVKKRIEFDIWDRRGESGNYEQHFGWTICARTFFVSCFVSDPADVELTPFGDSETNVDYEDVSQEATESESVPGQTENPAFAAIEAEAMPEKYMETEVAKNKTFVNLRNDYFTDLDDEFDHAWLVGATVIVGVNLKFQIQTIIGEAELNLAGASDFAAGKAKKRKKRGIGSAYNIGSCVGSSGKVTDETLVSLKAGLQNDILGLSTNDGRNRAGTDFRGLHGYSPNQPSNRPGQRWANAVRNGGGIWNGIFTGAADAVGLAMGVGTVSDDRSHLDGIIEEGVGGILGGVGGTVIDLVNVVAKPLGLEPILGMVAGVGGMALGGSLGGPAAAVIAPVQIGLQFTKVIAKALGLGGLIGMTGSKKPCLNKLAYIHNFVNMKRAYDKQYYINHPSEPREELDIEYVDYDAGAEAPDFWKQQQTQQKIPQQRIPQQKISVVIKETYSERHHHSNKEVKVTSKKARGRTFGSKAFQFKQSYVKLSDRYSEIDLYTPVGWRGLLNRTEEPFVGIGNCLENPFLTTGDLAYLQENPTSEEYAKLYLTSLRTACNKLASKRLVQLVSTRSLMLNKNDQTFDMSPKLSQLSKLKLTPSDISDLLQTLEVSRYSKAYAACFRKHGDAGFQPINPTGSKISNSIYFLVKFAFEVFAEAVKNVSIHLIKIVRNTILTLKTAFIKVLQNVQLFNICGEKCMQEENDETQNNALSLYTLIQFLMNQFEPKETPVNGAGSIGLENAYNEFYKEKADEFTQRLEWYTKVPLGKISTPSFLNSGYRFTILAFDLFHSKF